MGYAVVDPDDLDPLGHPERDASCRSISHATDLSALGAHVYDADPGDQIPLAYHYHDEQEEVFYVIDGTMSVETPDETFTVEAGQAFVVEPDSPQRAYNDADAEGPLRALVVGAPKVDDAHAYEP